MPRVDDLAPVLERRDQVAARLEVDPRQSVQRQHRYDAVVLASVVVADRPDRQVHHPVGVEVTGERGRGAEVVGALEVAAEAAFVAGDPVLGGGRRGENELRGQPEKGRG